MGADEGDAPVQTDVEAAPQAIRHRRRPSVSFLWVSAGGIALVLAVSLHWVNEQFYRPFGVLADGLAPSVGSLVLRLPVTLTTLVLVAVAGALHIVGRPRVVLAVAVGLVALAGA